MDMNTTGTLLRVTGSFFRCVGLVTNGGRASEVKRFSSINPSADRGDYGNPPIALYGGIWRSHPSVDV